MNIQKKMSLVSIGVPVFNGEKYIRNAIDSLLMQDYKNIEIIISDNFSSDNTPKILNELKEEHRYIRIYRNNENIGVHANFAKLVEYSKGTYFMWAAIDDLWSPEFVSTMVKELETYHDCGVAMCAVDRIGTDGKIKDSIQFQGHRNPNKKSHLGMALALTSPLKYNVFIYGLFRTDLLKSAIDGLLPIPSGDRWFLIQFAMVYKFRYVDSSLHIRTIHKAKYPDRFPEESFSQKRKLYSSKIFNFHSLFDLFLVLKNSSIIPRHRKLLIPMIITSLFFFRLRKGLRKIIKGFFSRFFHIKVCLIAL